jgi:hypothetical protein
MTQPDADADRRAAQERIDEEAREYSTWVAVADIPLAPGIYSYRVGHVVPISNVEAYGYDKDGLVVLQDSPEGRKVMGLPEPEPEPARRRAAKPAAAAEGGDD